MISAIIVVKREPWWVVICQVGIGAQVLWNTWRGLEREDVEALMGLLHQEVTGEIIGAAIEVWKELGYGYLERVYQRAMLVELTLRGLKAEVESRIQVRYKGQPVGEYQADLFVEEVVIVELKTAEQYSARDEAQLLNQLKATGVRVGMLINFGREKAECRRFIY